MSASNSQELDASLAFLRSIRPTKRQRSQTEFLHAIEAVDAVIKHFGPGKNPNVVSARVCKELLVRIFQATVTHSGGCSPLFERIHDESFGAYASFFTRLEELSNSGQVDLKGHFSVLGAVCMLEQVFFTCDGYRVRRDPRVLPEELLRASRAYLTLAALHATGKEADADATLRAAWPGCTLTYNDLLACAHLANGVVSTLMKKTNEAVPEIEEAVALAGVRLNRVFTGPALLFEAGRHAAATALFRSLLEKCKAEEKPDPCRLMTLAHMTVRNSTQAPGGWDPFEAQALYKEVDAAIEASQIKKWAPHHLDSMKKTYTQFKDVADAGVEVATVTGRSRLGSLGVWLHSPRIKKEIEKGVEKTSCDVCGKTSARLRRCSGCCVMLYCSSSCQKKDWKSGHKEACREAQAIVAELKAKHNW